jgi:hypothetical protein
MRQPASSPLPNRSSMALHTKQAIPLILVSESLFSVAVGVKKGYIHQTTNMIYPKRTEKKRAKEAESNEPSET